MKERLAHYISSELLNRGDGAAGRIDDDDDISLQYLCRNLLFKNVRERIEREACRPAKIQDRFRLGLLKQRRIEIARSVLWQ